MQESIIYKGVYDIICEQITTEKAAVADMRGIGSDPAITVFNGNRRLEDPDFTQKRFPDIAIRNSSKDELITQLSILQDMLDEITQRYCLSLSTKLSLMMRILEMRELHGAGDIVPRHEVCRKMVKDINRLKVKPKKGRVRDLIRIERTVKELMLKFPVM